MNYRIILDGAHNPAGARALAGYLSRFYSGRRVWLVYGAMRDKAIAEVTGILFPLVNQVIATAPHQSRAVDPETIRALADHLSVQTAPDLAAALEIARRQVEEIKLHVEEAKRVSNIDAAVNLAATAKRLQSLIEEGQKLHP